ncbi:MAG TPA: TonB-dependent receptor [Steroidobacteraceae bacterium]|nr:TonB-dependent receptor [Steroidobacteraceae bacterium]
MNTTTTNLLANGIAAVVAAALLQVPAARAATDTASATAGDGLAEIVVTARRRAENLQDVPVAVTAISAAVLEQQDVTSLGDLNSFVPNIKISADRATSSTINVYIRGVGQSDPLWGFEPGVGVYIDDVYMARPQAALLDVYDVDRLEILRGPQGTLYGKNTIAGAIKYVTRDIVGPASLTASVTGGNYGERDEKLSASTPVVEDHVYVGIAVADLHHDGYGHVLAQAGTTPSPYNGIGEDVSNRDVLAARGNLTILWGRSSKLKIVADTTQDDSNASGGERLNNALAPPTDNRYDTRTDMPVNQDRYFRNGLAATYTQSLVDQLDLKLVGAYREGHGRQFIDFEELNANLFQVPAQYSEHQGSGEGQLTFTNDIVKAVGGIFYMNSTACGTYNASVGVLAPFYLTSIVDGCVQTKSTAVYADTAWKLADQVNLDAGVRWNQDRKTASVYQAQYASIAPVQLLGNETFFDPSKPPTGFFPFPVGSSGIVTDYANSRTFSNVSPRLGVDYHFTPQVMGYVSYSRGFKSGGFDMRGNAALYPATKNGYGSETADSYELGVKSTLLGDTLQLNLTLFYDPYKNAQIGVQQFVVAGGIPQNVTAVLNAGKQINQGAEIESAWRPIKALTLGLNIGYLDSYYQDFLIGCSALTPGCTANSPPLNIADLNRPVNAPTWTVATKAGYTWDLPSGSLLARVGWDWRSFIKVANTTASVTDQPSYGLVDAGLAFTTTGGTWRVSLDGKNLLDRWYRVAGYDFGGTGTGLLANVSQIGFYGPPRTYQVTAQYHF